VCVMDRVLCVCSNIMDVERTESLKRKRDDDDGPGDRFGGARAVAVPAPLPTGKHPYSHYLLAGEDIVRGRVVDILYNNKPEKKFEWVEGIVALIGKPGGEHQNQICVHATGKGYHACVSLRLLLLRLLSLLLLRLLSLLLLRLLSLLSLLLLLRLLDLSRLL